MGLKDIIRRRRADSEDQGGDFVEGDDFELPESRPEAAETEQEKAVSGHAPDA